MKDIVFLLTVALTCRENEGENEKLIKNSYTTKSREKFYKEILNKVASKKNKMSTFQFWYFLFVLFYLFLTPRQIITNISVCV